jgi:PPM family protein phosphatase
VELLTIGAFSRASRLSPKALRLYDSLGLLAPAHVDEVSGYRFYRPDQLERARLVAWLRRLGMPLATSRWSATWLRAPRTRRPRRSPPSGRRPRPS